MMNSADNLIDDADDYAVVSQEEVIADEALLLDVDDDAGQLQTQIEEKNRELEGLQNKKESWSGLQAKVDDLLEDLEEVEFNNLSEGQQKLVTAFMSIDIKLTDAFYKEKVKQPKIRIIAALYKAELTKRLQDLANGIEVTKQLIKDKQQQKEDVLVLLSRDSTTILNKPRGPNPFRRDAAIDFGIKNTHFIGEMTKNKLKIRVKDLLRWHDDLNHRGKYLAPYFPIVQSSGVGKTKLLYELCQWINKQCNSKSLKADDQIWKECVCWLLACTKNGQFKNGECVFNKVLQFAQEAKRKNCQTKEAIYTMIEAEMNKIVEEATKARKVKYVILFFDEAQNLMGDEGTESLSKAEKAESKAILFRCVRWYLRKIPNATDTMRVVAVFAGTTAHLANFFAESGTSDFSKQLGENNQFYQQGKKLFKPFYEFVTTGCLSNYDDGTRVEVAASTEYDRAVPYGRPMFAMFHKENELHTKELGILCRMVLQETIRSPSDWQNTLSWVATLATRIQMDMISAKKTADLVSRGYATLVEFEQYVDENETGLSETDLGETGQGEYVAKMVYLPDPVLARLAMRLMDEKHDFFHGIKGESKKWWIYKAKELFSSGLCRLPKGDAGELFAALYLLFRGDEFRGRCDAEYKQFSVDLEVWIQALLDDDAEDTEFVPDPPTTKEVDELVGQQDSVMPDPPFTQEEGEDDQLTGQIANKLAAVTTKEKVISSSSVNFIQVCRNFMRYPFLKTLKKRDGESMFAQNFLAYLYRSSCAFYVYQDCPRIDLFGSILIRYSDGSEVYRPLLVSVKAVRDFTRTDAEKCCNSMKRMCTRNNMGGLCLLVVFGGKDGCENAGDSVNWKVRLQDLDSKPVAVVIRLTGNGFYGLVTALHGIESDRRDVGEILASSPFLRGHEDSHFTSQQILRVKEPDLKFLNDVRDDVRIWHGKPKHEFVDDEMALPVPAERDEASDEDDVMDPPVDEDDKIVQPDHLLGIKRTRR